MAKNMFSLYAGKQKMLGDEKLHAKSWEELLLYQSHYQDNCEKYFILTIFWNQGIPGLLQTGMYP